MVIHIVVAMTVVHRERKKAFHANVVLNEFHNKEIVGSKGVFEVELVCGMLLALNESSIYEMTVVVHAD